MKKISVAILLILALAGCCKQKEPVFPQDKFRVALVSEVADKEILIRHYRLEAPGARSVMITTDDGSKSTASISPVDGKERMEADLYFVAALTSMEQDKTALKWLCRITGSGVTVGGADTIPVTDVKALDDILEIVLPAGDHPLGNPITLGHLQQKKMQLTVK